MQINPTARGFSRGEFTDSNGQKCSIQISSAIEDEALLWLGCDKIELTVGMPWRVISDEEIERTFGAHAGHVLANTRLHLSQSQVRELLPLLQKFAETGDIE